MCICTLKKQKLKKKNLQWGCAPPPNVPKLGVSGVKDTAKTNKDSDSDSLTQTCIFLRHKKITLIIICLYTYMS